MTRNLQDLNYDNETNLPDLNSLLCRILLSIAFSYSSFAANGKWKVNGGGLNY